jgi:hypothetical protein
MWRREEKGREAVKRNRFKNKNKKLTYAKKNVYTYISEIINIK